MSPDRAPLSLLVLLLAALVLPGCLEQEVTTTIHTDGTCERLIVLHGGSALPVGLFPIAADTSWEISSVPGDSLGHGIRWTLKKTFASYEALAEEYQAEPVPGKLQVSVSVEKQFRWFYTYFAYRESYGRFSPCFNLVPPSLVMTDDEILRYTYGDTSTAIRTKVDEWEARNLFQVVYNSMVQAADRLLDLTLAEHLANRKEAAFRAFYAATQSNHHADSLIARAGYRGSTDNLFHDGQITNAGVDAMTDVAAYVFRSDSVRKLKEALRSGWKEMETKGLENIDRSANSEAFTNTIVMPGTVLETGAPEVKGNVLSWRLQTSQLVLHDYEMYAESRVINVWVVVLTGLLVLGLLAAAFVVPALARRHSSLTPAG